MKLSEDKIMHIQTSNLKIIYYDWIGSLIWIIYMKIYMIEMEIHEIQANSSSYKGCQKTHEKSKIVSIRSLEWQEKELACNFNIVYANEVH